MYYQYIFQTSPSKNEIINLLALTWVEEDWEVERDRLYEAGQAFPQNECK